MSLLSSLSAGQSITRSYRNNCYKHRTAVAQFSACGAQSGDGGQLLCFPDPHVKAPLHLPFRYLLPSWLKFPLTSLEEEGSQQLLTSANLFLYT